MNRCYLLFAIAGTALVVGCASAGKQAAVEDDDKEYVTGSRIPVKAGTGRASATTSRAQIDDMLRNRNVSPGLPN